MKKIVFTFGRYNPPTTGHAELITYTVRLAQKTGAEHRIYTSQSQDTSKNPLSARQKMAFLRQIFPGVNFVEDPAARSAFIIAKKLADQGYEDVTFVVGADRVDEFKTSMSKYVKPRTAKDFNPKIHYPFKKFQVVSSGARKRGISGTDLRAAVRRGDFATFAKASAAKDKTLARKIYAATKSQLNEDMSRKEFDNHLKSFINFTCDKLGIQEKPSLKYKEPSDQGEQPSFAAYSPSSREVIVMTKNRHPMDVFRSVAHELVHHKQNEEGRIGKDTAKEGATGSDIENEANSRAGELMRWYGKANPQCFSMSYVTEDKAIILSGTPGSGKDRILKEAILPHGFTEISSDRFDVRTIEGNVVVNGAANYERIRYIKEELEGAGYQTIMVFVNTSNEVSKQRNEARIITGGRVINEAVRYTKWKNAQDNLAKYDQLFEKVIEVKNDLNLNENQEIIQETYGKLMKSVYKEISEFALKEADRRFEMMLREMDTSRMPLSRNIQDIRSAERKADDAKLKSGEDIGNVKGPSYSWMKSPADYGSPDKPNYRYDMSSTKNYKAPIRPDNRPNIVSHDRTAQSDATIDAVNASRDPISKAPVFKENYSDFSPQPKNNPVGGAGNWGTSKLTDRYKADTPGEQPGVTRQMGYYEPPKDKKTQVKVFGNLPKFGDRLGATYTSAKNPSFVGDITSDQNVFMPSEPMQNWSPIDRWMMKEETRKRFKEKYGKLAEQKMKEAAAKVKNESLVDPYMGSMGMTPNATNGDDVRPDVNAEFEKLSIFKKVKARNKLNSKK